jgi:hypothetical protein
MEEKIHNIFDYFQPLFDYLWPLLTISPYIWKNSTILFVDQNQVVQEGLSKRVH